MMTKDQLERIEAEHKLRVHLDAAANTMLTKKRFRPGMRLVLAAWGGAPPFAALIAYLLKGASTPMAAFATTLALLYIIGLCVSVPWMVDGGPLLVSVKPTAKQLVAKRQELEQELAELVALHQLEGELARERRR